METTPCNAHLPQEPEIIDVTEANMSYMPLLQEVEQSQSVKPNKTNGTDTSKLVRNILFKFLLLSGILLKVYFPISSALFS